MRRRGSDRLHHGGRQLDGVVPTIVALSRCAHVVADDCVLLVDGEHPLRRGRRQGARARRPCGRHRPAVPLGPGARRRRGRARGARPAASRARGHDVAARRELDRRDRCRAPRRDPLDAGHDQRPAREGHRHEHAQRRHHRPLFARHPTAGGDPVGGVADHTAFVLEERRDEVFQYAPIGKYRGDPALREQLAPSTASIPSASSSATARCRCSTWSPPCCCAMGATCSSSAPPTIARLASSSARGRLLSVPLEADGIDVELLRERLPTGRRQPSSTRSRTSRTRAG